MMGGLVAPASGRRWVTSLKCCFDNFRLSLAWQTKSKNLTLRNGCRWVTLTSTLSGVTQLSTMKVYLHKLANVWIQIVSWSRLPRGIFQSCNMTWSRRLILYFPWIKVLSSLTLFSDEYKSCNSDFGKHLTLASCLGRFSPQLSPRTRALAHWVCPGKYPFINVGSIAG